MTVDLRDAQIVELLRDGAPRTATEIAQQTDHRFACHVDTPLRRLHRLGVVDRTPPNTSHGVLWWIGSGS